MLKERIKELRKRKKWTQAELAKRINVSQQTVASWEVGRAEPNSEFLIILANLFDVTLDYLLNGADNSNIPATNKHIETIAAHIDDDVTDDQIDDILNYIDFIKHKHSKKD